MGHVDFKKGTTHRLPEELEPEWRTISNFLVALEHARVITRHGWMDINIVWIDSREPHPL